MLRTRGIISIIFEINKKSGMLSRLQSLPLRRLIYFQNLQRFFNNEASENELFYLKNDNHKFAQLDKDNTPDTPQISKVEPPAIQYEYNFIIDDNGYVNVYTDGACSSNGLKNPKAGIGVWFGDKHPLNVSEPIVGRSTNNIAEIVAAMHAARQAKEAGVKKLKINTDSQFLIKAITEWMARWKVVGWKTTNNKPVVNKDELLELESTLSSLDVVWNHVSSHSGNYGNEKAHLLARAGILKIHATNAECEEN